MQLGANDFVCRESDRFALAHGRNDIICAGDRVNSGYGNT